MHYERSDAERSNPQLPLQRRDIAAREVEVLGPLLPSLEIEGEMERLAGLLLSPSVPANQMQLCCDAVAAKISALPDEGQRRHWASRLKHLRRNPQAISQSPSPSSPPFEPAGVLKLEPIASTESNGKLLPMHFVARSRFELGRFAESGRAPADFSCEPWEHEVSRVNTVLRRVGGEILIGDGDQGKPSTNGSKLDGEPLHVVPVPAIFTEEREITLGNSYGVRVKHLNVSAPGSPNVEDESLTRPDRRISGCLRFRSKCDSSLHALSVWIFSNASFGSDPDNAIVTPAQLSGVQIRGRIHFWRNMFWVENLGIEASIRFGDDNLAPGRAFLVRSGEILYLGDFGYNIFVEK